MNKVVISVPNYYAKLYPERQGQPLDEFLQKMKKLKQGIPMEIGGHMLSTGWSGKGYDKFSPEEKARIWSAIVRAVMTKGKQFDRCEREFWGTRKMDVFVARNQGKLVTWRKAEGF